MGSRKIKFPWYLLIFIIVGFQLKCKKAINIDAKELIVELDSIYVLDQKYRNQLETVGLEYGWSSNEVKNLWTKQAALDSSNLKQIEKIINRIGQYPGRSLVGNSAGKVAFYVLQHASDSIQDKYYNLILEAASNRELNKNLVAMYRDRYLMGKGEKQIFGTQIVKKQITDSITGMTKDTIYMWPIADTISIDSLRLWNGLGPLESYLGDFGLSRWN